MKNIPKCLLAGIAATIVFLLLMVIKTTMGLMPQFGPPNMLAGTKGSPDKPLIAWIVHFAIGIFVYDVAIAALHSKLPGTSCVTRGHALRHRLTGCDVAISADDRH